MNATEKTALLIIDAQVAMFTYEDFKLHDESAVLERLIRLADRARAGGAPVFLIQQTSWDGDEFQEGSPTWELHASLQPQQSDIVLRKTTCDSFHQTALQEKLQNMGINRLVVAGMQTDFCVDTTVRRAASLGYECILVRDAHSTFDRQTLTAAQIVAHHNDILSSGFARLQSAEEIVF
ncbi:cysteine hydrolase family protein [Cohnella sp. 56]|uniref:cysteine hydrolase family protein n=1 Tax=Cohnella sp. 56 TaxID=3113722 RepID=UPI0030E8DE23